MSLYKRFSLKGILAGVVIAAILGVFSIVSGNRTQASSVRDCDSNATIYCGALSVNELVTKYDNYGDSQHHYTDLHAFYDSFGINSSSIHSLSTKVSIGQVHSDGTVWLNGKQIGQNAMTAGRVNMPGSTAIPGIYAFMRSPKVSFASPSINAYIGYENGAPAFAILDACGNPVKWDKPQISISKQVQNPANGSYGENATFENGDAVHYLLTVKNTSKVTAQNVMVADALPTGQTYVKGSTKVNGKAVGDGIYGLKGINIGSLASGAAAKVTFSAKASLAATKCGAYNMTNTGVAAADNVSAVSDTANSQVKVKCVSQCTSLDAPDYDIEVGKSVKFTASAVAKGVTITAYTFRVNDQIVQSSTKNTFVFTPKTAGNKKVSVAVKFSNGNIDGDTGNCVKHVTVTEKPKPVASVSCDSLTADKYYVKPSEELTFTAKASAKNAKIKGYVFKVNGDVKQTSAKNTYVFSQKTDGDYIVSVVVQSDHGDVTSADCAKKVHVQSVPKPIYDCNDLTVTPNTVNVGGQVTAKVNLTAQNGATFKQAVFTFGDEAAETDKFVTNIQDSTGAVVATHTYKKVGTYEVNVRLDFAVNGKVVSVSGDDACKANVTVGEVLAATPPATPSTTLPNTGVGNIFGIFAFASLAGTAAHYIWTRRFVR